MRGCQELFKSFFGRKPLRGRELRRAGSLPRKSLGGNDLRRKQSGDFGVILLDKFRNLGIKRVGARDQNAADYFPDGKLIAFGPVASPRHGITFAIKFNNAIQFFVEVGFYEFHFLTLIGKSMMPTIIPRIFHNFNENLKLFL